MEGGIERANRVEGCREGANRKEGGGSKERSSQLNQTQQEI